MPFKKTGPDTYTHKGRKYTGKQVRAYYATEGFERPPRKPKDHKAVDGLKKAKS